MQAPSHNLSAERRHVPFVFILHFNRIDMRVKQDRFLTAADSPHNIPHRINRDLVVSKRNHLFLDELDDFPFLPRKAFDSDQVLSKFDKLCL